MFCAIGPLGSALSRSSWPVGDLGDNLTADLDGLGVDTYNIRLVFLLVNFWWCKPGFQHSFVWKLFKLISLFSVRLFLACQVLLFSNRKLLLPHQMKMGKYSFDFIYFMSTLFLQCVYFSDISRVAHNMSPLSLGSNLVEPGNNVSNKQIQEHQTSPLHHLLQPALPVSQPSPHQECSSKRIPLLRKITKFSLVAKALG